MQEFSFAWDAVLAKEELQELLVYFRNIPKLNCLPLFLPGYYYWNAAQHRTVIT